MKVLMSIVLVLALCVTSLQSGTKVGNSRKKNKTCKITECGEFTPPLAELGNIQCNLHKGKCVCTLKCPPHFKHDNAAHKKVQYWCKKKNGAWIPSDKYTFCKASEELNVHSVHHKLRTKNLNAVTALINELFSSSYTFLAMSTFYGRADVSLPGFEKLMTDLMSSDQNSARDVMKYINKRGAPITLTDIRRSPHHEQLLDDFFNPSLTPNAHAVNKTSRPALKGVKMAIETNKHIMENVQSLITMSGLSDPNTKHYLEHGLLSSKVKVIKKLSDVHNMLMSFPDEDYTLGEYMVDQDQLS